MVRQVLVTMLYEDREARPRRFDTPSQFGLHKLVTAMVYDSVNGQRHVLEQAFEGRPLNGNTQVIQSVRFDAVNICRDGRHCVAVLDNDQIRRAVGLPKNAPDDEVIEAVLGGCTAPRPPTICLLKENLESVLQAVEPCDPTVNRERLGKALQKKLDQRDLVFAEVSKAAKRAVRDCILERVPSLKKLIDHLHGILVAKAWQNADSEPPPAARGASDPSGREGRERTPPKRNEP